MAMKNLLFKIFLILITVACMGCGATSNAIESEMRATVTYQVQSIPRFRDMTLFPGNVTGYILRDAGLVQSNNTICLEIYNTALPAEWDGLPVVITMDMQSIDLGTIDVVRAEDQTDFCFSPFVDQGRHIVDVDLITPSGIDSYAWEFVADGFMGLRPYALFPGDIRGFDVNSNIPYRLLDHNVCMEVPLRILLDSSYQRALNVRVDDEAVTLATIEENADDGIVTYCVVLEGLPAGFHDFEIELRTIGSDLIIGTNEGLFDGQSDMIETGSIELYGWEFVVVEE